MNIFIGKEEKLRELWWVAIFYLLLACLTIPIIILAKKHEYDITLLHQAVIVLAVTLVCHLLHDRKGFAKWLHEFDLSEGRLVMKGLLIGSLLMLVPSVILFFAGWVTWESQGWNTMLLLSFSIEIALGVLTEELIFRGFVFRRFINAFGQWPSQIIISLYFVVTHVNNPGLVDGNNWLALINIFVASLVFGTITIRTQSLSMAIATHFAANWAQGVLLGFGVSGYTGHSFFLPAIASSPTWLTGGEFGLEGSLPGTITVIVFFVVLYLCLPNGK